MYESGITRRAVRRGRILVVDDEPFVARALGIFLGDEHAITIVNDARDALARLDGGERFDVILCDLMMPHMNGVQFHAAVAEKHPDEVGRIVFITGGIFTPMAHDFLVVGRREYIEKPPDPFALRAMVRSRVAEAVEEEVRIRAAQ